jgi:hypothetical protein
MTLASRGCKVQVQPSRVSARMAALTVVALALALTRPLVPQATTADGRHTAPEPTSHKADGTESRKRER